MKRFLETNIDNAIEELRAGKKRTCWIWYVFPQLRGLGNSWASRYYGIKDFNEARKFLDNDVLRERLNLCCQLLLDCEEKDIVKIMGSKLDARKLQSSMTLFLLACGTKNSKYGAVIIKYFNGELDKKTLKLLYVKGEK